MVRRDQRVAQGHRGIEPGYHRVPDMRVDTNRNQVQSGKAILVRFVAPRLKGLGQVGDGYRAIDQKHGLAGNTEIALVRERTRQVFKMCQMIAFARIDLLDQQVIGLAMPDAAPAFVGPAQTEREIRLPDSGTSVKGRSSTRLPANQ